MKKPEKPYKSIKDARYSIAWGHQAKDMDGFYPCISCSGRGKVHRREDCCPVEGYKMASWYKCEKCGGKGNIGYKAFKVMYDKWMDKYDKEMDSYRRAMALVKSAKEKITRAELEALKRYHEASWVY